MHLLPSRGRPAGLQRFFDEGKPEQPGVVITEEDQREAYSRIPLPANWTLLVLPATRVGYVRAANAGFALFPNEPWYGLSGDDSVGRTPHWDTLLGAAAAPDKIVWPNDLFHGRSTQPFVGGDLCRALGWFAYPKLSHLFCDTVWGDIHARLGNGGGYMPHVVYEHLHWGCGKRPMDTTDRQRKTSRDEFVYRRIDWNGLMEKLRPCTTQRAPTAESVQVGSSPSSISAT